MKRQWKEKELEEYVAANPGALGDAMFAHPQRGELRMRTLGTQIQCQHGIIDMLCYSAAILYVVEFKAVTADEKTIGQVIRYKSAIEKIDPYEFPRLLGVDSSHWGRYEYNVSCIVVAPRFTKEARMTADAIGAPIKAQPRADGTFSLSWDQPPRPHRDNSQLQEVLRPYVNSIHRRVRRTLAQPFMQTLSAEETASNTN